MSRRGRWILFLTLLVTDAIALGIATWLTINLLIPDAWDATPYMRSARIAIPIYLLIFYALRLYDLDTVLEDSREYSTLANGCTYGILGLILVNLIVENQDLWLVWLLVTWIATIAMVWLGRLAMRWLVRTQRRNGHLISNAIIIGADEQGRTIANQLKSTKYSGLKIVGFVDDFLPVGTPVLDDLKVIGHPTALKTLTNQHVVKEIVLVPGAVAWETFKELVEKVSLDEDLKLRLSPGYYDLLANTPRVAHRNFVPLISLGGIRFDSFDRVIKALIDFGLGAILFILALPLMLITAILMKILGHGKTWTNWNVTGIQGSNFKTYVFNVNAKKPLGRFFRSTGLHVLPLLAYVLLGRMSLVGPRPIRNRMLEERQRWLPALASVKPGVTGPWAIVPESTVEEEMRSTLYYIRNWTPALDLQILVQTIVTGIRRRWQNLYS